MTRASEHTRRQLADALRHKLVTKPLQKITIRELVEECGLNRQTFYYNFKDIYDLLRWMFVYDGEQLLNKRLTTETWEEALLLVLRYLEENRQMCCGVLSSVEHEYLRRFLYDDVEPVVSQLIEELSEGLTVAPNYQKFLTHFYTLSIASLILTWIMEPGDSGCGDAEELIRMLSVTLDGNLRQALQRYSAE